MYRILEYQPRRLVRITTVLKPSLLSQNGRFQSSESQPTMRMNSGCSMPVIGIGTWKMTPCQAWDAVKCAIGFGYRHIDCAHVYQNEREVGQAIQDKINDGTVCREQLFVTGKLWNTYHGCYEVVKQGLEKSLCDLKLSYLDLFLIHWPFGFENGCELFPKSPDGELALKKDIHFTHVWKSMELLVHEGLVRNIGVSNFNSTQIEQLLQVAQIPPAVNQVECHPHLNQVCLSSFCRERGIQLVAYSPLGSPGYDKRTTPGPLEDPVVKCIANTHKKTPAQILIRYQIQRGHAVIPKSVNAERICQNFNVFDFCLMEHEMNQLLGLEKGKQGRVVPYIEACAHPEYPFKELLTEDTA